MIYATCINCGFVIDIFANEELANLVREKRLKYLTTRDQICPNCLVAIAKCEKVEADENDIPILRTTIGDTDKDQLRAFAKEHGYSVVTDFTVNQFKHPEAATTA